MKFLKGQVKKPKRIIALLIITLMMIGIISLPSKNNIVYANPPADTVYINTPMGQQDLGGAFNYYEYILNDGSKSKTGTLGTTAVAHFNQTTGVLTLQDYNFGMISVTKSTAVDLTVKLIGSNSITNIGGSSIQGLYVNRGNLNITSDVPASLNVNVTGSSWVYGISANGTKIGTFISTYQDSITLSGNVNVQVNTSSTGGEKAFGIVAYKGVNILDNASYKAVCTTTNDTLSNFYAMGVNAGYGDITINTTGTIDIDCSNTEGGQCPTYGLRAYGDYKLTKVDYMVLKWSGNNQQSGAPYYSDNSKMEYDEAKFSVGRNDTTKVMTFRWGTQITFTNSASYNIPESRVGTAITPINVSGGVSGGKTPYTYRAIGLPAGLTINSSTGIISGTPTTATAGTTNAWICAKDADEVEKNIKIDVGKVTLYSSVSFTAEQVGGASGIANSTGINLTFNQPVIGLTLGDITITDGTGAVTESSLYGSDTDWTINLSLVKTEGDVNVSINDFATFLVPSSRTVSVYKDERTAVTFSAFPVSIDEFADTTGIKLIFDKSVTGIKASDITITNGTGSVTKGKLTGSGTEWIIELDSIATSGNITVEVLDFGELKVATPPQTVTVHKDTRPTNTFTAEQTGGILQTANTTAIEITFANPVSSLEAGDIVVTNASGEITTGTLSGSGTTWTLQVTGVTKGGIVVVRIPYIDEYKITTEFRNVIVYKNTTTNLPIAFTNATANGTSGSVTSTDITLVFDKDPVGLAWNDITITDGTGSARRGTLLGGSGNTRTINLSEVYSQGTVTVHIADFGAYNVTPTNSRSVSVYHDGKTEVSFTAEQIGGIENLKDSTAIALTFSEPITGLTYSDVWLDVGDMMGWNLITEGNLTGSGTDWVITLDNVPIQGKWDVMLSSTFGAFRCYPRVAQDIDVYKDTRVPITFVATEIGGTSGTINSTGIMLTFSEVVTGLTADDITIADGLTGSVAKGTLAGSGKDWVIDLVGVYTEGDVDVSVASFGTFKVTTSSQNINVFKEFVESITYVDFTAEQTGGTIDEVASTGIVITFSEAVTGLTGSDITVTNGSGEVTKGTLSGLGTTWTMALTDVAEQGEVIVSIADFDIFSIVTAPQPVAVYKDTTVVLTDVEFTAEQTGGTSGTADSTGIVIEFDEPVTGLIADAIIITDDTGVVEKGEIINSTDGGYTWVIELNSVTTEGNVIVNVVDFETYNIITLNQTVAVYKDTTAEALTGTATIDNTLPKIGDTLTATLPGTNNTGTLSYQWKADGTNVGNDSTYIVVVGDLGKVIKVEITSSVETGKRTSEETSAVVKKDGASVPSAPTEASKTTNSITLTAVAGYEYKMDSGAWQDSNVFSGLSAGTEYTFVQRIKEIADTYESATSGETKITTLSTPAELTGTAEIWGTAIIGNTLTANLDSSNNTGTLSYQWKADGTNVGTGSTYIVVAGDFGKVIKVEITSSIQTGTKTSAETPAVMKKMSPPAPALPTLLTKTDTSITLTATAGYEYRKDGGTWQDSNVFSGLTPNTSYDFEQRVKETADTYASTISSVTTITTEASAPVALTGTAVIDNTSPKVGDVLTGSYTPGNNTGTLTYTWKSGATTIGIGTTYTITTEDLGETIILEITSSIQTGIITSGETGTVVKKDGASAPSAPTEMSKTHNSITLIATAGYEYAKDGGTFQDSNIFTGLDSETSYSFTQRIKETADTYESATSTSTAITTGEEPIGALTGTANISNTSPKVGDILTGSYTPGNNTGTLTYTWKTGATTLGTGTTYTVKTSDIGNIIKLEITSDVETGDVSEVTSAVVKKTAGTPATPTLSSKTDTSITLTAVAGYEYKIDSGTWQDSNVFSGLSASTAYTFIQRIKETADTYESLNSTTLTITTDAVIITPPTYTITAGINQTWKKGTAYGLQITCDGDFVKFNGLKVDGVLIDESNYTKLSGSTIITLKTAYLETLALGDHTLQFVYNDGNVSTLLTIAKADDTTNTGNNNSNSSSNNSSNNSVKHNEPKMNDPSNINLLITIAIVSLIGLVITKTIKKDKRRK